MVHPIFNSIKYDSFKYILKNLNAIRLFFLLNKVCLHSSDRNGDQKCLNPNNCEIRRINYLKGQLDRTQIQIKQNLKFNYLVSSDVNFLLLYFYQKF